MTLVVCGYTYVAPTRLVESIITPSLETLSISGREEVDDDMLRILRRSDTVEENLSRVHNMFCYSVTDLLQASNAKLRALHFSTFYAGPRAIWSLFSATADTLGVVSFRYGRSAVLKRMRNTPATSNIHWTVDLDESVRRKDQFAGLTIEFEGAPKFVFRRVWSCND